MSTVDSTSFIRSESWPGWKALKTTAWIAPILAHASIAMGSSGIMGR
jgi:hypothetical protein